MKDIVVMRRTAISPLFLREIDQRILPIIADLKALGAAASASRMPLLLKFLSELYAIETEAMEFGLLAPNDDYEEPALLNGFRDGPS